VSSSMRPCVRLGLVGALAASGLAVLGTSALADPPPPAGKAVVDYPNFANAGTLARNGTAAIARSGAARTKVLRLTNGGYRQAGSAWAPTAIDPHQSFTTTFEVSLHGHGPGADGFAFVLQNNGVRALGGTGGGLGYRGRTPSVEVEFDIFRNLGDPDGNHVAVMANGHPEQHLVSAPAPFPMFGTPFAATVAYDAPSTTLSVWVHPIGAPATGSPLLSRVINLGTVLGSTASYAGFTAGTGDISAVQDILSWQLNGATS
jgi:Legume lectin domain